MANDLMNPPEVTTNPKAGSSPRSEIEGGHAGATESGAGLDALMGKAFDQKSIFADLYDNIHEIFFPTKLPPLELTSTPIPVPDPMAVKWNPASLGLATLINAGILALMLFAFRHQIINAVGPKLNLSNLDVNIAPWKPVTKKAGNIGGGGGGGAHELTEVSKGHLPKIEKNPILQPQIAVNEHPKLVVTPAIDVQPDIKLPDNPTLPQIGVLNSHNNVVLSNGQGSGGGMGNGKNGGLGTGNGNGYGPGEGGNVGGGVRRVGDGVTAPKPIFQPEAEFSDEARRAKYEGMVVVSLIVDAQGNPQNVHVTRALGMGLDEKAIEAVKQYRFKPAIDQKTGKPVPVMISVEVNFHLY
jgi:TonB family protein